MPAFGLLSIGVLGAVSLGALGCGAESPAEVRGQESGSFQTSVGPTESPEDGESPDTDLCGSRRCPSPERVRAFVTDFMAHRVDGQGAEEFLAPDAEEDFGSGGLAPLYEPTADFVVEFVDGPLGPDGSFEVGVAFLGEGEDSGSETLFVQWLSEDDRLVVAGGRPGLSGP